MTTSKVKKTGCVRQPITRTACEPCREKRAKCDGQKPCGRCQTRGSQCHFIQRAWASKRSLQDEATALREKLRRRDRILEVLGIPGIGEDVARMLREGGTTVDDVFEKLEGGSTISLPSDCGMREDTEDHQNSDVSCECQNFWSPSMATTNLLSTGSQGHGPFSFNSSGELNDDSPQSSTISQPSSIPGLQNQSAAMQTNPDPTSFGSMLDNMMPMNLNMDGSPTIIDPLVWPSIQGSDSLGQPMMNSWTGLMGDATGEGSRQMPFSCLA